MNPMVKNLVGKARKEMEAELVALGQSALPMLLQELVLALDRIENAPVGYTHGALSSYLGRCKLVNPHDQALAKRIPRVVWLIASSNRRELWDAVRAILAASPDERVRHAFARCDGKWVRTLVA